MQLSEHNLLATFISIPGTVAWLGNLLVLFVKQKKLMLSLRGNPHGDLPDLGSIHFDKTTDNVSSFNLILKKIVLVIIVGTFCQVNELTFLYTALLGFVYPLHRFMK